MKTFLHLNRMLPADMPQETVLRYMARDVADALLANPDFYNVVSVDHPYKDVMLPNYKSWSICISADIFKR